MPTSLEKTKMDVFWWVIASNLVIRPWQLGNGSRAPAGTGGGARPRRGGPRSATLSQRQASFQVLMHK